MPLRGSLSPRLPAAITLQTGRRMLWDWARLPLVVSVYAQRSLPGDIEVNGRIAAVASQPFL